MFSSYPTTTLVPTRRAQTPPVSSLPTSPSDEVGRRQSLTSPDSQPTRPQNRTGTCEYMHVRVCHEKLLSPCDLDVTMVLPAFAAALSDPSSRLSTSPPPPAIAVPLLEMGFSLRQITKALEATGQSASQKTLNVIFNESGTYSENITSKVKNNSKNYPIFTSKYHKHHKRHH